MEQLEKNRAHLPIDRMVFGLVLVVVGIAGFGLGTDLWEIGRLVRYWPVLLIALGLASEAEAIRHRHSDGGSSVLIGVGVWLLLGTRHFFDLTVRTAFPIGVAIVGLGIVLHALIDRPVSKEKESHESHTV